MTLANSFKEYVSIEDFCKINLEERHEKNEKYNKLKE